MNDDREFYCRIGHHQWIQTTIGRPRFCLHCPAAEDAVVQVIGMRHGRAEAWRRDRRLEWIGWHDAFEVEGNAPVGIAPGHWL